MSYVYEIDDILDVGVDDRVRETGEIEASILEGELAFITGFDFQPVLDEYTPLRQVLASVGIKSEGEILPAFSGDITLLKDISKIGVLSYGDIPVIHVVVPNVGAFKAVVDNVDGEMLGQKVQSKQTSYVMGAFPRISRELAISFELEMLGGQTVSFYWSANRISRIDGLRPECYQVVGQKNYYVGPAMNVEGFYQLDVEVLTQSIIDRSKSGLVIIVDFCRFMVVPSVGVVLGIKKKQLYDRSGIIGLSMDLPDGRYSFELYDDQFLGPVVTEEELSDFTHVRKVTKNQLTLEKLKLYDLPKERELAKLVKTCVGSQGKVRVDFVYDRLGVSVLTNPYRKLLRERYHKVWYRFETPVCKKYFFIHGIFVPPYVNPRRYYIHGAKVFCYDKTLGYSRNRKDSYFSTYRPMYYYIREVDLTESEDSKYRDRKWRRYCPIGVTFGDKKGLWRCCSCNVEDMLVVERELGPGDIITGPELDIWIANYFAVREDRALELENVDEQGQWKIRDLRVGINVYD